MDAVTRRIVAAVALIAGNTASPGALAAPADADMLAVAWRRDGAVYWSTPAGREAVAGQVPGAGEVAAHGAVVVQPVPTDEKIPLGSLWKLFVYAYLSDTGASEPVYRCAATRRRGASDDDYCCDPGASVGRDEALARSCAPYFDPARLRIGNDQWRRYWQRQEPAANWLQDLARLRPDSELTPEQLLAGLDAVPPAARQRARAALLAVLLEGYGQEAWPLLGTAFRFKTFSWHSVGTADRISRPLGGGAGWLADGTAVWFGASGSSRTVLSRHAATLAGVLPALRSEHLDEADSPCVEVDFFARYPIRRVLAADGRPALAGTLAGRVLVEFDNGSSLPVSAQGRLELSMLDRRPRISGRFPLDEYVARVIDREGSAEPTEAARALAIAARSYVVQQGRRVAACWAIADASSTQRVSPHPPSAGALAAARFSEGLVLRGAVRYHRDRASPGVLSWQRTVLRAGQGQRFDVLLSEAFGRTAYSGLDSRADCERLPAAEAWLSAQAPRWQRELRRHAGYESPEPPAVCALPHGQPYADQRRGRIYLRDWMSAQGRLTLTHEYLHLAFRHHPNGADERFVEATARRLEMNSTASSTATRASTSAVATTAASADYRQ